MIGQERWQSKSKGFSFYAHFGGRSFGLPNAGGVVFGASEPSKVTL